MLEVEEAVASSAIYRRAIDSLRSLEYVKTEKVSVYTHVDTLVVFEHKTVTLPLSQITG